MSVPPAMLSRVADAQDELTYPVWIRCPATTSVNGGISTVAGHVCVRRAWPDGSVLLNPPRWWPAAPVQAGPPPDCPQIARWSALERGFPAWVFGGLTNEPGLE